MIYDTVFNINGQKAWRFYGCYGPSRFKDKKVFWEAMEKTMLLEELQWVMIGDLMRLWKILKSLEAITLLKRNSF